jgi:hypothetical protein
MPDRDPEAGLRVTADLVPSSAVVGASRYDERVADSLRAGETRARLLEFLRAWATAAKQPNGGLVLPQERE